MTTRIQKLLKAVPKPPVGLIKSGHDLVLWKATTGGKKIDTSSVCYAPLMGHLSTAEIQCFPFDRGGSENRGVYALGNVVKSEGGPLGGRLSPLQYGRFMNNLRKAGILPEGMEYHSCPKKGNCLYIPGGKFDQHTVFMVLNFYRLMDSVPDGIWSVFLLQDFLREHGIFLPFSQTFFYSLFGAGVNVRTAHATPLDYPRPYYLWDRAWGFATFYHMSLKERQKQFGKEKYTHNIWRTLETKIGTGIPAERATDLLSPKVSPIFTHPEKFGKAELEELVKSK